MKNKLCQNTCLALLTFFFINSNGSANAEDAELVYIETKSKSTDQIESEIITLQSFGIHASHIFPPNAIIARACYNSELDLGRLGFKSLHYPDTIFHDGTIPENQMAFGAWQSVINQDHNDANMQTQHNRELIRNFDDERVPPDDIFYDETDGLQTGKAEAYTSQFLIGRSAIKIILMESIANGEGDENWTTDQENLAVAEIVKGADYWIQKAASHNVNCSFAYEVNKEVQTSYEPINENSVPYNTGFPLYNWVFDWIDDALNFLGYERDEWDGCFDMANDVRKDYYSDWGFSLFVIMDAKDLDHQFRDGKSAYVRFPCEPSDLNCVGACFIVTTYTHTNYETIRHEIGHIYRAWDEYEENCDADDCTKPYGYLQIVNGNCESCNNNPVECVMKGPWLSSICDYTLGQIGWRDTDGDGPADPIDQNGGGWMSIPDVEVGDIIYIYSIGGQFQNVLTVTNDNSFVGYDGRMLIWNGCRYDNSFCPWPQMYAISINGGDDFSLDLHPPSSARPVFVNIGYNNGKLFWELDDSFAYVRCFIYDEYDNQIL